MGNRWRISVVLAGGLALATAGLTASSPAARAANPVPLPAALAGQSLVQQFSPSVLAGSTWNPTNEPGNCPNPASNAFVNASGFAEIDTNGANNDCRSMQSPQASLPTRPGTTYEALVNFSSFADWPAFWMYGPNWPDQGEIDAVEGGPGSSHVTWHQAGNHTVGPDPWDNTVVPHAGGPNIVAGQWTTVDIAYTASGVDIYYQGKLYVHIPESVTTSGNDPMFLTISEGSCHADGTDVCNGGTSPAGSVQVQWVREFSGGGGNPQVTLSNGRGVYVAPTREDVTWNQSAPSWVKATIAGPGAINGHVSYLDVTGTSGIGHYTGLESGHGYTVTLQPEVSQGGANAGPAAQVYFVS